jgi:uncharacterized protein YlzI (FlbEa/FlbD family)
MFIQLTAPNGKNFMVNMDMIIEISHPTGEDAESNVINSVLFTALKGTIYKVQETMAEVKEKIISAD